MDILKILARIGVRVANGFVQIFYYVSDGVADLMARLGDYLFEVELKLRTPNNKKDNENTT